MNLVVIRVDQLRRSALQLYNPASPCPTPAIDALAAASAVYTQAITTEPKCAAHRSSFDVGKHSHALPWIDKLDPNDRTIHGLLQYASVDTFHVGKWHKTPDHLKDPNEPQKVPGMALRGMNYHAGHEQKHDLVNGPYWVNGASGPLNAGAWRPQKHVDLFLARLAQATPPFYGVLDLEPPHGPLSEITTTQWNVFQPSAMVVQPNVPQANVAAAKQDLALYYGMLLSIDDAVEQVMSYLDVNGYLADTTVIFTSDHGAHLYSYGLGGSAENEKCSLYPEATDVPLLIRGLSGQGSTVTAPWGTMAFAPWILELFGVEYGTGLHHGKEPAGLYLEQVDEENTPAGAWRGILLDGWRYARASQAAPWVMFDTNTDPFCLTNLVGQGNSMEPVLEAALQAAAAAVGDVIPW